MMLSSLSTSSDETPIMSNSSNATTSSSSKAAASVTTKNAGGDPLSSASSHNNNNTSGTTSRTGSMRRAAAMAASSALASLNTNSNTRPSSPNDFNNGMHTQQQQAQRTTTTTQSNTSTTTMGPIRRRHRATPADNFHPRLITAQILSLQCFHYTIQGFLFQINFLLYNTSITIDRIFTDTYVQLWHPAGWPDVAAIFFSALFGAVLLAVIVEKSKKCLDFCVTYFLLHLILSSWYTGHLPRTSDWWIVHLAATLIMVLVGEYVCSRKELSDIPLLEI